MKKAKKSWFGLGALGGLFLSKLKLLLVILKFFKLSSLISIFISIGSYAIVYGWKFAIALVYLLFVHEMGHLYAAKKKGIKTSNAIFIPFFGAFISLKEEPKNANDEAFLAFLGPLFGTMAFLPAIPLLWISKSPFWLLFITLGSIINLFNLMPIHPLDGGRIVGVISTKFWLLGIVGMVVYMILHPNFLLTMFLILGVMKWWSVFRSEIVRRKRSNVVQINTFAVNQMEQFILLEEEEKIKQRNRLMFEVDQMNSLLTKAKKICIPFKDDTKLIEKSLLELKISIYNQLLDRFETLDDKAYIQTLDQFKKDMHEESEKMIIEKNYYISEKKTKLKWFLAYVCLGLFLMITTMLTGNTMKIL